MMQHKHLLSQLLPLVSYDSTEPMLKASLTTEGEQFDRVMVKAESVVKAITPYQANDLIFDWERVLGLKASISATLQERVKNVLLKLAEVGGLSVPYFINLGKQLGYEIVINELTPFYADVSQAGDVVYDNDVIFIWQVVVNSRSSELALVHFRASASSAGEQLMSFIDPVIEQVFDDLKPAHTFVYFAYKEV